MSRREAFILLMRKIRAVQPTPYRRALLVAARDMVELSGGGHPDEMLHVTEPKLCALLNKYIRRGS